MTELSEQSIGELRMRQQLGREVLRLCAQMEREGEKEATAAKEKYGQQLKEITGEIRKRRREAREAQGLDKPPANEIGLQVARLGSKGR